MMAHLYEPGEYRHFSSSPRSILATCAGGCLYAPHPNGVRTNDGTRLASAMARTVRILSLMLSSSCAESQGSPDGPVVSIGHLIAAHEMMSTQKGVFSHGYPSCSLPRMTMTLGEYSAPS